MTKYKPIHEHQDGRGTSVRYANQTIKRRKARRIAEKMMGKNYFGPEGTVSADYINSEKNLRFSKWEKTFAIKPQKTISGKIVWLKTIYKRRRWMHIEPPQFPVNTFNKVEYAEWEDILNLKMKK